MKKIIVLGFALLALGACSNPRHTRMAEGAGIGGVGGAVIGGLATGRAEGAVVGGVVGAAVGAVIADETRPRHRGKRCYYNEALGHRVCRYR